MSAVFDSIAELIGRFAVPSLVFAEAVFWIAITVLVGKILIEFVKNWWLDTVRMKFIGDIKWVLLEVRFPKGNLFFPKSMEQVFSSFYQIYSFGIKPEKKWLEGQIEEWISAEMVSSKEGIRFFIRVNKNFRNLVEKAIFAQYPEAEIIEADYDYINDFPPDLPNEEYDILGADMILGKNTAYPIRTYPYFFGERKFEEQEVDPIAALAEVMSNLKEDERMWVQVLVRPDGGALSKESKALLKKLSDNKEDPKKMTATESISEWGTNLIRAPFETPVWSDEKPVEKKPLAPYEADTVRAVAQKSTKLAFQTMIRIIYIDKKNDFTPANFAAALSTFQQFNTSNLNFLRPSPITFTKKPRFFFRNSNILRKKKRIYKHYIKRTFTIFTGVEMGTPVVGHFHQPAELYYMNIEELATIFHPPIMKVGAPGLRSLETKKGAPPANLPIEE
ncbi:MAG: hypothetical protein PHP35_00245 [Candidatus Colwellbacteria bacterium]|nr:hypothetical protein [Candidatus Colwellbacteria bacterium]